MAVATPEPEQLANEGWVNNRWRPAMAWQYFAVCIFDFIVFPGATQVLNGMYPGKYNEWHSLTLQGGGFYHLAMGGIIGVAVWQRSQEKMAIYSAASPGGGSVTTERTVERSTSVTPPQVDTSKPAQVDIKADVVQVNRDPAAPSPRAD